ncbi:hypothetical protein PHYPSEUDO_014885 [Phytophthora pseudosyringae]|uniref:RxLR effector protein n=1 Tax=Phytophthora pseudosyringae TaxID=221518 RepID=A0A8T1W535_9STRA|nr:hypothetical protein PHYPSEUDO_014885 [Phytophthora pseudosyringae]
MKQIGFLLAVPCSLAQLAPPQVLQMASPSTEQAPPTAFKIFFAWCKQQLAQRGWGRLDEAAARYLRTWGLASTSQSSNTGGAIKRLLDAVPHARITKTRLIEAALQGDAPARPSGSYRVVWC